MANMASIQGDTVEDDSITFLSFRMKLQASRSPLHSGAIKLITCAHGRRLTFLGLPGNKVKVVPTDRVIEQPDCRYLNEYTFTHKLTFRPTMMSVAQHGHGNILMVAGYSDKVNMPVIQFIDIDILKPFGRLDLKDLDRSTITDYSWHPRYRSSGMSKVVSDCYLLALCTSDGCLVVIASDRIKKHSSLVYRSKDYDALTCCWSPEGKYLAIGTSSGQLTRLEPHYSETSLTFTEIEGSRKTFDSEQITPGHKLVKLAWTQSGFLVCVHAKPDDPESPCSVYSLVSKDTCETSRYWTSPNKELANPNYTVYILDLQNAIIAISNTSNEAVIFCASELRSQDLNNWKSIWIQDPEQRLELPPNTDGAISLPTGGVAITYLESFPTRPILVLYTDDGHIYSYATIHDDDIMRTPSVQEPDDCPIILRNLPTPPMVHNTQVVDRLTTVFNRKTITEEDEGLDLPPATTPKSYRPRESIAQWSVERQRNKMSVRDLIRSRERK